MTEPIVRYADMIGQGERPPGPSLSHLELPWPLGEALMVHMRTDAVLTPPQDDALRQGVLTDLAHFLVCAPTNSGKTLIAVLRIFARLLRTGGRYVYVAPLKALAEQKVRELRALAEQIGELGGKNIAVRISTGDYRISEDFLDSPPDEAAEILVCTPERLEVLLRNPDYRDWAASVDTFVLDEFHILGQQNRGARYETMVTQLLLICPACCLLALSATIGSLEEVSQWLAQGNQPLRLVTSEFRVPCLRRRLLQVPDKDAWILDQAATVLSAPDRSLLVFVYRQNDVVRLAKRIATDFSDEAAVAPFHSGLPLQVKNEALQAFHSGRTRVLVCTTSLAMGINTPATDVIVRDTVFHGYGRLQVTDILQMTGRAGRGSTEGAAAVLFSEGEQWQALAAALEAKQIDPLVPRLIPPVTGSRKRREAAEDTPSALTTALLGEIGGKQSVRFPDLQAFISHTYSAVCHGVSATEIHASLQQLIAEKLVYRIENSEDEVAATKLGRTVSQAGLSAESGALMGAFLRSMISLSEKEAVREAGRASYLHRLKPFDFLAICLTAYEARALFASPSYKINREHVCAYIEALDPEDKPLMYLWRDPDSAAYPTRRLASTLRLSQQAGEIYWKLMSMAAAMHDYSRSRHTVDEISSKWGLKVDLEGRLIPLVSWILNALVQVSTGSKCYRLDFLVPAMRALLRDLAVGGGFGRLLEVPGVGLATVEKLKGAGYSAVDQLESVTVGRLAEVGVRHSSAVAITRLLARRAR
jgi:replicative superfamily II helicase